MNFDLNDPKVQAMIGVAVKGLGEIFSQCLAIYNGANAVRNSDGIAQEKVAIRRENLSDESKVAAKDLPPEMPDPTKPIDPNGLKVPTWAQLLNLYNECAVENYKKNFKPCDRRREANIVGVKACLKRLNISLDEPYTCLTRARMSQLEDIGLKEGKSRQTIQTWRAFFKSVTARWAVLMYEDRGWEVKPIVTMPFNMASEAYVALPKETVEKIDAWIEALRQDGKRRDDFKFVWLMRNFAIRNGDVFRYVWGNFSEVTYKGEEVIRSSYIPNKTSKTSRRHATWEIAKARFESEMLPLKQWNALDDTPVISRMNSNQRDEFQRRLNAEIKALLPEGRNKGLYELRKLRAHEIFVKFGRKACVRATGDSFDTLEHNYVDTSADDDD